MICQLEMRPHMTAAAIWADLVEGRPVLIGYRNGDGSGHAVLVTRIVYTGHPADGSLLIHEITVRDPWPGVGRRTYVGRDLGPRIMAVWRVRAQVE